MKTKIKLYFVWILVLSNLFYQENLGLNALIVSLVSISIFGLSERERPKTNQWWLAAGLWFIAGFSLFMTGTSLGICMYFLTFLYFMGIHHNYGLSAPMSILQALQSFFTGLFYCFDSLNNRLTKPKEEKNNKWIINTLLVLVPLIIAITFLKLYQIADETFYELTKFINLDWISWGFLGFYFFLTINLFGFYYFRGEKSIDDIDESLVNQITPNYSDKIQNYLGLNNEIKGAIGLLITLNLMLVLYNGIDLNFIIVDFQNPDQSLRYSQVIHEGINALITSIILVILLITFLFRGKINFSKNRIVKNLAYFWIAQNIIMVVTTMIKNYEYVSHWGLTYKRLGVYIYLFLAAIGLIFTLIKLIRSNSFWYLLRMNTLAFLVVFTILPCFNWNSIIAKYNLSQIKEEKIDFQYLLNLGEETYPYLLVYHGKHQCLSPGLQTRLAERTREAKIDLQINQSTKTWRSLVMSDYYLQKDLEAINLIYETDSEYSFNTSKQ